MVTPRGWFRRRFRTVPYIPQLTMLDCGAASLAMVMAYHGRYVPLAEVRDACGASRDGASAFGVIVAAHEHGLIAEGLRTDPEELADLPLPAILHWDFKHFVVLERVRRSGVNIIDPAFGARFVGKEQLRKSFTGVALTFQPGPAFQLRSRSRPSIARYVELVRQSFPNIVQLLTTTVMLESIALVVPVAMQIMIDSVIFPRRHAWLTTLALAFALSILVKSGLTIIRSRVMQYLQASFDIQLTTGYLKHLLELPLAFFRQRAPGDLLQRLKSTGDVRDFLSTASATALLDMLQLAGYAALMLLYNRQLGFLVIALGAFRVGIIIATRTKANRILAAQFTTSGGEWATLVETLSFMEMVKGSRAEATMLNRCGDRRVEAINRMCEYRQVVARVTQYLTILDGSSLALVLWFGGRAVIHESMTLGVFAAFVILQALITKPLQATVRTVTQLRTISRHLERLDDVFATVPETTGDEYLRKLSGRITFDHVSYRYAPKGPLRINDMSFEVAPGEFLALVGPMGSGKSTIAQLIAGLIHPEHGHVQLDSRDIRDFDRSVLQRIGLVLQDVALFNDTVRANIALHDTNIPFERVQAAARLACIEGVINGLPFGYDTIIGENGQTLSGGQRQRLALARALAADPAVLILDEATRSQDAEIEARITENLSRLACTRIVIAHRASTIRQADRILVIKGGRIEQQGTFEQLSSMDGVFGTLFPAHRGPRCAVVT